MTETFQLGASGRLTADDKLELCVKRIFHGEGCRHSVITRTKVMLRTLDLDGGSSKELVRIILKELGLATQVLRLANSAMYNHSGRPILSIAQEAIRKQAAPSGTVNS